jgi:putative component of membrane protein insertase Oxa1/YidC/SpoIIIJ protein YidD
MAIILILKFLMMPGLLNKILICTLFLSAVAVTSGQDNNFLTDITLINNTLSKSERGSKTRAYIYKDGSSVITKFNPFNIIYGSSLYIYQNVFSKHFSADCLFTPGCSDYSKQAVREYGLPKGILLTIDRLNRCNRIAGQDLKHYSVDSKTHKYPDPVSRYRKVPPNNEE